MNWFDVNILLFLNQFANHWRGFDFAITRAYSTNLNGGVVMGLACLALFDPSKPGQLCKRSELLLGAMLLSAPATLFARALALSLPFRLRPLWTPALHFHSPQLASGSLVLLGWSAFPSDHATLFFALATGIFFASRPLGLFAYAWVAALISFPALYLGIHWPTDVIAGACLGVSFACLAKLPFVSRAVGQFTTKWHYQQPGLFFALLFLWSYEVANLFDDGRRLLSGIWHLI
jgi:undecaprenyl-diphosphatase